MLVLHVLPVLSVLLGDLFAGVGDLFPRVEHRLGGEQRTVGRLSRMTTLLSWFFA